MTLSLSPHHLTSSLMEHISSPVRLNRPSHPIHNPLSLISPRLRLPDPHSHSKPSHLLPLHPQPALPPSSNNIPSCARGCRTRTLSCTNDDRAPPFPASALR